MEGKGENLRKASSSDRLPSILSLVNTSRTSELIGSLDRATWWRFRMTPGFAGPGGTRASSAGTRPSASADMEREGAAIERRSSGVRVRGTRWDDRVWARFERNDPSSKGRDLLGILGRLDEVM